MSLHLPSRRIVRSAAALTSAQPTLSLLVPCVQKRCLSFADLFGGKKNTGHKSIGQARTSGWRPTGKASSEKSALAEDFLKKKPAQRQQLMRGGLASSSILEDEEAAGEKPKGITTEGQVLVRNPATMAAALDPDPMSRKRWERKMVIKQIHKRGRLSKAQLLKKQERVILSKSHDFKTSVKKLVPLAKQITGKTVDEAILQMRFSVKKVAADVKMHLEHAKNEAIVRRGMGLGLGKDETFQPLQIMTKDKKRVKVQDPTTLYVDQAWCGKGLYGRTPDHRARGQIHIMKNRHTSLTLVLKEEKTRIRLHEEKQKKIDRKPVWVQLPNRPITAQRQYYSW